ncbi:hypothetical protein [Vibrio sonorensis]|uniref:hypothetical protein n=1 Tax=Vibrio sonorensis TaxID=1004316 RepID=UPI0008D9183F|nr:hypothetical protein [Vibrio sonorensis]
MAPSNQVIVSKKNQWMKQHIDVQFPTKESIEGEKLYASRYQGSEIVELTTPLESHAPIVEEIYKVDFHRLTVMFAILQSNCWPSESEQSLILEYLSQVIYQPPCTLFLGFKGQEPVAGGIVTEEVDSILVSDLCYKGQTQGKEVEGFAKQLINYYLAENQMNPNAVWMEL